MKKLIIPFVALATLFLCSCNKEAVTPEEEETYYCNVDGNFGEASTFVCNSESGRVPTVTGFTETVNELYFTIQSNKKFYINDTQKWKNSKKFKVTGNYETATATLETTLATRSDDSTVVWKSVNLDLKKFIATDKAFRVEAVDSVGNKFTFSSNL